jgi:hypothetical protein
VRDVVELKVHALLVRQGVLQYRRVPIFDRLREQGNDRDTKCRSVSMRNWTQERFKRVWLDWNNKSVEHTCSLLRGLEGYDS